MNKITFRTAPHVMKSAVLYAIGQMEMLNQTVDVATIARFAGVTKPTARKYLGQMEIEGKIDYTPLRYRPHVKKDVWTISQYGRDLLEAYPSNYANYCMVLRHNYGIELSGGGKVAI